MFRLYRFVWLILVAIPVAHATSFISRPFPTAVEEAPVIVRGKVGKGYSDWGTAGAGGKRLYTYTEVEIVESLKGDTPASKILVREMGGEKDGLGMHVPGSAEFKPGEEVVLMLGALSATDQAYPVKGMMMSKLTVEKDSEGNEWLAGPALSSDGDGHAHENTPSHSDTHSANTLAYEGLKKLISDQKKSGVNQAESSETVEQSRSRGLPQPSGAPSRVVVAPPASPLQTMEDRRTVPATESPSDWRIEPKTLIILGVGILLGVLFRRRRR